MNRIEIITALFEHQAVKPDSVNQCSFGQDLAEWLQERLRSLTGGGTNGFSEPIQEDYGWGFWAMGSRDRFWIAISYVGDGPLKDTATWIVSIEQTSAASLVRNMLHKSDDAGLAELSHHVQCAFEDESAIKIVKPDRMH